MLGLVDFFKAVYGTVSLALKRVHPLAGPALVAVLWVVALGSLLWITNADGGRSDGAADRAERSGQTAPASSGDDGDGASSSGGEGSGGDGEGSTSTRSSFDDDDPAGDGSDGDGDDDDADGSTLESPGGPGRVEPPSTGGSRPSWTDPDESTTTTTTTTTSPSTTPTAPGPTDPTPTTPTTQAPAPCNDLLSVLLSLLIPC